MKVSSLHPPTPLPLPSTPEGEKLEASFAKLKIDDARNLAEDSFAKELFGAEEPSKTDAAASAAGGVPAKTTLPLLPSVGALPSAGALLLSFALGLLVARTLALVWRWCHALVAARRWS